MTEPQEPTGKPEKESFYAEPVWKRFYAFLLGPALVAAGALAVFTIVSVLTREDTSPDELVQAMKSGGEHRRWQAAFALTKFLQPSIDHTTEQLESDDDYQKKLDAVRLLVPELMVIYDDTGRTEPEVRRFLALAFSYLGDPRLVPPLIRTCSSEDVELVHYSLAALAKISERTRGAANVPQDWEPAAIEAVIAASRRQETDIRVTAIYALGAFGGPAAVERLEQAIGDPAPDVRWNAAFGLARYDNRAGEQVIAEILDRGPIYTGIADPARQDDLFLNAVRSAGMVRSPMLRERLSRIAEADVNTKARAMAMKILEES
jgi:HEAT repeat protein